MKKFLALILCLMMALTMVPVLADDVATEEEVIVVPVEELFEGAWVQFEDGFELYLPVNWLIYELTEEQIAGGAFFAAGTEDGAYSCTLGWKPLAEGTTIDVVYADMLTGYPDAQLIMVNGVYMVTYVDTEYNSMGCVALDGVDAGMYLFGFTPADDVDFQMLATLITCSIRNIEVE